MQILIDISEVRYKDIQRIASVQLESNYFKTAEQIIANGIPLPKNHGRLIDADALKVSKHPTIVEYQYINEFYPNEPVCEYTEYYRCDTIRNAPTIIEADKEEEK